MFQELKKSGRLEAHLQEAVERTFQETNALEEQGLRPDEAWEIVREKYLLIPPRKE